MRVTAFWPRDNLHFMLVSDPEEGPHMAVNREATAVRPVFWILATLEEAERFIVPHMVNSAIHFRHVARHAPDHQRKDIWLERLTPEFSFSVPYPIRLTDEPVLRPRIFPHSGMNHRKPILIGDYVPGHLNPRGLDIEDIEEDTLRNLLVVLPSILGPEAKTET